MAIEEDFSIDVNERLIDVNDKGQCNDKNMHFDYSGNLQLFIRGPVAMESGLEDFLERIMVLVVAEIIYSKYKSSKHMNDDIS